MLEGMRKGLALIFDAGLFLYAHERGIMYKLIDYTRDHIEAFNKEILRRVQCWLPEIWDTFERHGYSKDWLLDYQNIERVREYPISGMSGNGVVFYLDDTPLFMVFPERMAGMTQIVIRNIKKEDYIPEPTKIPMKPLDMGVDLNKVDISKEMEMLFGNEVMECERK